jgi:hypothetical protein
LVAESPEAAIAHFGVSAGDKVRYLIEPGVLIRAEPEEQAVFLLSPGLLGLLVPLFQQIFPRNHDLRLPSQPLAFLFSVNFRNPFCLGLSSVGREEAGVGSWNEYIIILLAKEIITVVHVFKNYEININPFLQ